MPPRRAESLTGCLPAPHSHVMTRSEQAGTNYRPGVVAPGFLPSCPDTPNAAEAAPDNPARTIHERRPIRAATRLSRHGVPAADRFPMRGDLPKREPQILARWEAMDLWSRLRAASRRPAEVHPARRPALCERQHPYRHRAEQDPQGRHQPHAPDGRLRRRLHPRLGLPRPADRVEDRGAVPRGEEGQGRGAGAGLPRRVPRLRAALDGGADGRVPPPRRRGRLARALRHDGPSRRKRRSRRRSAGSC